MVKKTLLDWTPISYPMLGLRSNVKSKKVPAEKSWLRKDVIQEAAFLKPNASWKGASWTTYMDEEQ